MIHLKETPLPDYVYIHKYYHTYDETFYCDYEARVVMGTLHAVDKNGKHGLIGYRGNILIPFAYDDLDMEGHYIKTVLMDDDDKNKLRKDAEPGTIYGRNSYYAWDDLGNYSLEERLRWNHGVEASMYGLFSLQGEELLPCVYGEVYLRQENDHVIVRAWKPRSTGHCDLTFTLPVVILENTKHFPKPARQHKGEVFAAQGASNTLHGYKNAEGKVTIPSVYPYLEKVGRNHILAEKKGRGTGFRNMTYMLLDEYGSILFDEAVDFLEEYLIPSRQRMDNNPYMLMARVNGDASQYILIDCDGNKLHKNVFTQFAVAEGMPAGFAAKSENGWSFFEICYSPNE